MYDVCPCLYLHLQFVGSFLGCLLKVGLKMELWKNCLKT
jgi:hypothetical protein